MATFISRITVVEAAAAMNAAIAVIRHTFGFALITILIYSIHNVNSAVTWTIITRSIHSSLWPTLLRADSVSTSTDFFISLISTFGIISTALIVVASVVTPLGLKIGPNLQSNAKVMNTSYVPDISPIGLATSPRNNFIYRHICSPMPCPGDGNNANTSSIAPQITDIFTSTPHGVFDMQFRRYYQGTDGNNYPMSLSQYSVLQSLVLRDGIFAVEGLVVDLTLNPGIGLWNHTMPPLDHGGAWSHDMLWLLPDTSCVNTNLTLDYVSAYEQFTSEFNQLYFTDQGGFVNLGAEPPVSLRQGQDIDLYAYAYRAAVLYNSNLMRSLNITRDESYVGKEYTSEQLTQNLPAIRSIAYDQVECRGYNEDDIASIANVAVHCGLFFGPPVRTDGGDPRLPSDNSTWRQSLHLCASATKARIQSVQFSSSGTSNLDDLRISRRNTNTSVFWAVENTTLNISNVDIFWGQIADSYKDDPSVETLRSEILYLPAGAIDIQPDRYTSPPSTIPGVTWSTIYNPDTAFNSESLVPVISTDYSGNANIALLTKWQSILNADPENGAAQITNCIWVDLAANNLVGTNTASSLSVTAYVPSLTYDISYGIPAFLVSAIWLPVFLVAVILLLTATLKLSHMRHLLDQTSTGRIVVGDSALTILPDELAESNASYLSPAKEAGKILVAFEARSRVLRGESAERTELLLESTEGGEEAENGHVSSLDEDINEVYSRKSLRRVLFEFDKGRDS